MKTNFFTSLLLTCAFGLCLSGSRLDAQQKAADPAVAEFEQALTEVGEANSAARQRLAVRRVIRDADKQLETLGDNPQRWVLLEFLFRAQQHLTKLDDDAKHREALIEICRELVKAPDAYAEFRLEADLLLSQIEQVKKGDGAEQRADALRPFVARYIGTSAGPKALQTAMLMALEFGNGRVISDLRKTIDIHYGADYEMINFQREYFKGEIFNAPFAGSLKNSDGKLMRFPMDVFGTSAIVLFWSKEGEGLEHAKRLAKASQEKQEELAGRITVLSCNVDDLADAGESIIRGLGVDWPCLRLPGGRENPFYKTYAGSDPFLLRLNATGQAAIGLGDVRRHKEDGSVDYEKTLESLLSRSWTELDYSSHLVAMSAGDFLVFDPEGGLDPAMPPELKVVYGSKAQPLERNGQSVPEESLKAIQDCFVSPLLRQRLTHDEQLTHYRKAADLCRKVIADYPDAPELWMVRNRLIVSLMGLWKTDGDLGHIDQAFVEAKAAMDAGYPNGCDVVARFCLARQALRSPEADTAAIIDEFLKESGGNADEASGPALAAACMLALDVADRVRFERYRDIIIKQHTEEPMMWLFASFLLDRHHQYWMFQVPYTFGWIYDLREGHFITDGNPEQAKRMLKAELRDADGKAFRIPEDLTAEYTAIFFAAPAPWSSNRDDGLPPSPERAIVDVSPFVSARPNADVQVALALLADEPYSGTFKDRAKQDVPCTMLAVPDGLENPLVQRLGLLSVDQELNGVILDKSGRILAMISGLSPKSSRIGDTLSRLVSKVVARQDELKIQKMLELGEVEAAKKLILTLAPHLDPVAEDEKGKKNTPPEQSMSHLRARARVYMALKEWDKALADAEEICKRRYKIDADMSLRSDQLGEDEDLRDEIKDQMAKE